MTDIRTAVELDQFIAASPAVVWRGLTEPDLLARWWAPGDIAATAGPCLHHADAGVGRSPLRGRRGRSASPARLHVQR